MAEFLGSAPPTLLLMLMVIPVIGMLVVGFLFVSFFKRASQKDSGLYLDVPAKASLARPNNDSLASTKQPLAPTGKSTLDRLPDRDLSTALLMTEPASSPKTQLDTDSVTSHLETESLIMNPSKQSNEEKINLAARLGNLSRSRSESTEPDAGKVEQTKQPENRMAVAPSSEPLELLRLLRDPDSGQLIVEIAGRRYTKLADIVDKEIGQYVLKLTAHLLAFTNGMIGTEAGVKSVYVPKVGKTPEPIGSPIPRPIPAVTTSNPTPPAPSPEPDIEAAFLASLRAQTSQPEPPPPSRKGLFGRAKPAVEEPQLITLNLAQQINQIVQARLMQSPLPQVTKLEVLSEPSGGIRINVNNIFYASPDEIPDPEVKELIKASIRQWEQS